MQISKLLQPFLTIVAFLFVLATSATAGLDQYGNAESSYEPDTAAVTSLQIIDQPIEIILFHGTWCSDTQREVSRFMKVLELSDNPNLSIEEYEVDRLKVDETGKYKDFGIEFVPTFIVLKDDHELGRIIERPQQSLAEDLFDIIEKKE